ncbi:hypothetical protein DRO19_02780 [Candidatus Bathyarchaeota archaeon]|nr:MAG: hypothetical protein DRO19_02780 [Candidatus Bathyarchaeota archaeon]
MPRRRKRRKSTGALTILLIGLLVLAFIVGASWIGLLPFGIGYQTGAQGLDAYFHSLYTNAVWLSSEEKPESFRIKDRSLSASTASNWFFGYELNFDPDQPDDGFPNLLVTQQPFTVDTQVEPKHYTWMVDKGTTTLENGTILRKYFQFEMWRFRLEWAVNIFLSGPEGESWDQRWDFGIAWEPDYGGVQIWIKLIPKRFVYFEDNPDEVYFAPAYIGLLSYRIASIDKDKRVTYDDPDMASCIDLIPKAVGETLGIYYARGGVPVDVEEQILSYEGIELDPSIFREEYWIHFDLLTFKPWNHVDIVWKTHSYKWPSINLKFVVYVFVVGKWTVYFTEGEVPELNPHNPPSLIRDPWAWLANIFSNPFYLFLIGLALIVILLVILAIFAPGVLAAVGALGHRASEAIRSKSRQKRPG